MQVRALACEPPSLRGLPLSRWSLDELARNARTCGIAATFTPTPSSWMNLVERFFADVTEDCVRAGSFASVEELTDAITSYLAERNQQPRPYQWKASGKEILAKIQRARAALAEVQG